MIPTEGQAKKLWDKYQLPESKRRHVELVAKVARWLAEQVKRKTSKTSHVQKVIINEELLIASALLHDIDKNIPKLPNEQHPDTGVRILCEEGMGEVAALVKTHSLHAILDSTISPKTWEEKILYLADKMVKHEVIGVDARFRIWNDERLPPEEQRVLDAAYPKVKELEKEVLDLIGLSPKRILEDIQGG